MTEYRGEVWQCGIRVALAEGVDRAKVHAETAHYAMMYAQDGEVTSHYYEKKRTRWKLVGYLPQAQPEGGK